MKKPYRLVVFDWEGTLGDTLGHVLSTLDVEARRLHFGDLDVPLARRYVMLGLVNVIKKLFPDLNLYQQEQLLQAVQRVLYTTSSDGYLFPNAKNTVQRIQKAGMDLAIATNRGAQSLKRALQESGLSELFKVTRTAGQVPPKPCPQMLEEIMDVFGVNASETLMIGDSLTDIEMSVLAGVDAIGVDFYHQHSADLLAAGALQVFDDYTQLADYLELGSLISPIVSPEKTEPKPLGNGIPLANARGSD